ncbi:MAG: hypothetical protein Q8J88_10595 [Bacteroidales bacterium]|nr:hypothetical protein [Bacteroidales bacterium]
MKHTYLSGSICFARRSDQQKPYICNPSGMGSKSRKANGINQEKWRKYFLGEMGVGCLAVSM